MTPKSPSLAHIVAASSVGTMIEFYDFFIFASLAPVLATQFYPPSDPNVGFFSTLLTLAVGVAVRPIGSLIFGRVGDTVGRKTTFLITLLVMGGSTAAIGCFRDSNDRHVAQAALLRIRRGSRWAASTPVPRRMWLRTRLSTTRILHRVRQAMPTVGLFASTVSGLPRGDSRRTGVQHLWRVPFPLARCSRRGVVPSACGSRSP
jgi:MFS family permease